MLLDKHTSWYVTYRLVGMFARFLILPGKELNMRISNPVNLSLLPDDSLNNQLTKSGFEGHVKIYGKAVKVSVSPKAYVQLVRQNHPVRAEMELYFSCLIRKRVLFTPLPENTRQAENTAEALPGLFISFNPVTTKECRIVDNPQGPLLKAMPVKEPARFVPDWIKIHHRSGQWTGEYGFKTHA